VTATAVVKGCKGHLALRPGQKGKDTTFGVAHFAGVVTYEASDFVVKNASACRPAIVSFLRSNGTDFVREIFGGLGPDEYDDRKQRKLFGRTLISAFRTELDDLCSTLEASSCRHVRCLRPNDAQTPLVFDEASVSRQCKYSGLLEATRIRRQGYPHRRSLAGFVATYRQVLGREVAISNDLHTASKKILEITSVDKNAAQVGKSKVFLRQPGLGALEGKLQEVASSHISRCGKGYVARRHLRRLRRAVVLAQACWRGITDRRVVYEIRCRRAAASRIQIWWRERLALWERRRQARLEMERRLEAARRAERAEQRRLEEELRNEARKLTEEMLKEQQQVAKDRELAAQRRLEAMQEEKRRMEEKRRQDERQELERLEALREKQRRLEAECLETETVLMVKEEPPSLGSTILLDKHHGGNVEDIEPITLLSDEPTILAPEICPEKEQQRKEKFEQNLHELQNLKELQSLKEAEAAAEEQCKRDAERKEQCRRDAEREDLAACEAVRQRREKGGRLAAWEKQFRRTVDSKENTCPKPPNVISTSPKLAYTPTKFGSPSKIPKATVATLHSPRAVSPRIPQVLRQSPRIAASPYKAQVLQPTASPATGYRNVSPRGMSPCRPLPIPRRGQASNPTSPKQATRQVARIGTPSQTPKSGTPSQTPKSAGHNVSRLVLMLEDLFRQRHKPGMTIMPGTDSLFEELEQRKDRLSQMLSSEMEPSPDLIEEIKELVNGLGRETTGPFNVNGLGKESSGPFNVRVDHMSSVPVIREPVRRRLRRSMSARSTREGLPLDLQTPPPSARTPQLACRTPSIMGPVLPVVDSTPFGTSYELGVPVDLGTATPGRWAWQGVRSGSASPRTRIGPVETSSRPGTPAPMMPVATPVALMRNMSAGQMMTVQSSCPRATAIQAPVAQATTVSQASFTPAPEMRFQATPINSTVVVNRTPLREVRCTPVMQAVHRGGTPMRTRWPSPDVHLAR
jgi:hypothetical protein